MLFGRLKIRNWSDVCEMYLYHLSYYNMLSYPSSFFFFFYFFFTMATSPLNEGAIQWLRKEEATRGAFLSAGQVRMSGDVYSFRFDAR